MWFEDFNQINGNVILLFYFLRIGETQEISLNILHLNAYSRVPNKRTGRWLETEKNPTYTHLFGTIRLLIFSKTDSSE